ncbi:MAG TPA: hypothetical protein VK586_17875 [Streptosporangiaceae bacterium]|nr:hypothetical protein [Streptosporangiaceae bacterium]
MSITLRHGTSTASRVTYVRESYHDEMAAFLLSGDNFRVTGDAPMAAQWREILGGLVQAGFMGLAHDGRYWWHRYVIRTVPAGPIRMVWQVCDSITDDGRVMAAGHVAMHAAHGQAELDAAAAKCAAAAAAAIAELPR